MREGIGGGDRANGCMTMWQSPAMRESRGLGESPTDSLVISSRIKSESVVRSEDREMI